MDKESAVIEYIIIYRLTYLGDVISLKVVLQRLPRKIEDKALVGNLRQGPAVAGQRILRTRRKERDTHNKANQYRCKLSHWLKDLDLYIEL